MSNQSRQRALEHALDAALVERAGRERYRKKQDHVRRGARPGHADAREADGAGSPISRQGGVLRRVARLVDPR
jgi:hypothetical protein